jgi:hypothetical protein
MRYIIGIVILLGIFANTMANPETKRLQEILDSGADLVLGKGKVYEIDATLQFKIKGQRIYTEDAKNIRDYATLRVVKPTLVTIINAESVANIVIQDVLIDGNRDNMRPEAGKIPMLPFISLGKRGGDDQTIKNCIITNARCSGGWAAIHVHENAFRTTIQDNIIFGSGTDVLGNGRSALEYPFGWGDGISVAARNSLVKDYLIIDATDEGIMVQGAPGTKVLNNVIVALSREVLGGVALIDPADYCLLASAENTYDYRGVEVKNNLVDALGARVHIGFPCGADVWNFNKQKRVIVGGEVIENEITGKIGAYGFALGGVKDFIVIGNKTTAVFEERGDGLPNNPPDEPAAFIYDATITTDCKLQKEFKPAQKYIVHLMRNFRRPVNEAGYRVLKKYGEIEAEAIVSASYMEMLNRFPSKREAQHWQKWLHETRSNADAVRTALMISAEFQTANQAWRTTQLQECRVQLFMEQLYRAFDEQEDSSWPEAHHLHKGLFSRYKQ